MTQCPKCDGEGFIIYPNTGMQECECVKTKDARDPIFVTLETLRTESRRYIQGYEDSPAVLMAALASANKIIALYQKLPSRANEETPAMFELLIKIWMSILR